MSRYCLKMREQLADAMRTSIREAFAKLCSESGDVSMERVAASLGIAKGTIYVYYKTKEELVKDALDVQRDKMICRMDLELTEEKSDEDRLLHYARIMMEEFQKNRFLRMEFIRSNPFPAPPPNTRNIEILKNILERGIQNGTFRSVSIPETIAFIRAALIGQFRFLLKEGRDIDISKTMYVFEDMVLRALLSAPHIENHFNKN